MVGTSLPYTFPGGAPPHPSPLSPLSYVGSPLTPNYSNNMGVVFPTTLHQKSLSGTSAMMEDFVSLKLERPVEQQDPMGRPVRRLHPLMNDTFSIPTSQEPNSYQEFAFDGTVSASTTLTNNNNSFLNSVNTTPTAAVDGGQKSAEIYFDDETGMAEEQYEEGFDFNAVITKCSWGDCEIEMNTQEALVSHILLDHVGTGKASYVCMWKGCTREHKPFSKRHKIQNHIRIHTGERPFACPVPECGKKFSRQDGLNTHIKTHSSVKPYVCPFPNCGKAYFHSRSLRKHERTHLEVGTPQPHHHQPQYDPSMHQSQFMYNSNYIQTPVYNNEYGRLQRSQDGYSQVLDFSGTLQSPPPMSSPPMSAHPLSASVGMHHVNGQHLQKAVDENSHQQQFSNWVDNRM